MARPLAGQVAIVAGATRGAGRGVARGLGEAGAVVYCTGRSTAGRPSPYGRPETIEETAALVTAAGGEGIPVRVDHAEEAEVRTLVDRVIDERGRLDVLASSVGGEDPGLGAWTPLWSTELGGAAEALRNALLSHLITAAHAARVMKPRGRGLIVEITEGDLAYGGGNVLADVVKSALKALAWRIAEEMRPHGVAAVAITPGFLRSERMLEHFGVTEASWRDGGRRDPHFLQSETPLFLGRAVAALAADPGILSRSGELLSSWQAAREYGLTDADGSRPDWGAHWTAVLPSLGGMRSGQRRHAEWLERVAARARAYVND